MSQNLLHPPQEHHHHHHHDEDDEETQSLLWSASSSINDFYYETSDDSESTISYATFHTVKEPEHLIDHGTLYGTEAEHIKNYVQHDHPDLKGIRLGSLIFCLCISVGLLGLDGGIVLLLLNPISTEFKSSNLAVWIHLAYLFGCLFIQPLCRNMANSIGRKASLVVGQCMFLVGSLSCSAAQSMLQIIIARIVAGVGGGMLLPLSSIILLDHVSEPYAYERYQTYIRAAPALGFALGPYIGGLVNDWIGWRYCFYINLVPCLTILCIYLFCVANYRPNDKTALITTKSDYFGMLLLTASSVLLVTGIALGGNFQDWNHPMIVALLSGGGLFACVFILYETCWAMYPLFPSRIICRRNVVVAYLIQFSAWSGTAMIMFLMPQFFMGVMQHNAPLAGLWIAPKPTAFIIGAFTCFCLCVTRSTKFFLVTMAAFELAVLLSFAWWTQETHSAILVVSQGVEGYASGALAVGSAFMLTTHVSQRQDLPLAVTMMYTIRTLGELFGMAAASAIFQSNFKASLSQNITEPDVSEKRLS
ncbi:major facilitator superfamily domain-containing protein [Fennellomyces sp. T-0311]|nr:major facilitator superfamily domain-containing protein [Fennellomyces sp. T-0311]